MLLNAFIFVNSSYESDNIMRVLIVDLENQNEKLFSDILNRYRFNEHKASTIKKARSLLNDFHPHIIIMSLYRKDEWSFLEELKENHSTQQLPIVAIANNEKKRDQYNERYEYLEIFVEPVKLKNIRHAIQRWTHYGTLYRDNNS